MDTRYLLWAFLTLSFSMMIFSGGAFAQDWRIPLGGEEGAVLDARTIQNIYPAGKSGWVNYKQQTDEGILTVEMQLFAICSAKVVRIMRMVVQSSWDTRVVEHPIPEYLSRIEIPSQNVVADNFFYVVCD